MDSHTQTVQIYLQNMGSKRLKHVLIQNTYLNYNFYTGLICCNIKTYWFHHRELKYFEYNFRYVHKTYVRWLNKLAQFFKIKISVLRNLQVIQSIISKAYQYFIPIVFGV